MTRLRRNNRPDTSALRLIGLDALLSREQLNHLAQHTDIVDVPADTVLARVGTSARQFVAVVDGYVDITDPTGASRTAGPGTHFGATELIEGSPFAVTVVACTAATLVVIFGPAFRWSGTSVPSRPGTQPRVPVSVS